MAVAGWFYVAACGRFTVYLMLCDLGSAAMKAHFAGTVPAPRARRPQRLQRGRRLLSEGPRLQQLSPRA